jgi:hypothetical protein
MIRSLPSHADALKILARLRTRPARRPPPPASRAVAPTLKALEARFGHSAETLAARWEEIVGKAIARRTEPVRISGQRSGKGASLEVRVDGPAATLIQHQAADILARANMFLGAGSVERLRIIQGPLKRPARVQAHERPRPKGPLDAAAEQELARGLANLPDGALKQALTRLGREVMRGRRT